MPRSILRALLLACATLLLGALPALAQSEEQTLPGPRDGSVMVGIQNDVALAAGEETDAVFVVQGTARIEGAAKALVAVDSDVTISGAGASVDSVLVIGGTLDLADGATVKDLAYAGTTPTIAPTATVTGKITNIESDFADFAAFLARGAGGHRLLRLHRLAAGGAHLSPAAGRLRDGPGTAGGRQHRRRRAQDPGRRPAHAHRALDRHRPPGRHHRGHPAGHRPGLHVGLHRLPGLPRGGPLDRRADPVAQPHGQRDPTAPPSWACSS